MNSSNYLYSLRTKLGLTSEDFATLIDCNRGILSMAEIGRRSLPVQSRWLVSRLEQSVQEAENDNTIMATDIQTKREVVLKNLKKTQLKLNTITLMLEQATEKYTKTTTLIKTLTVWSSMIVPTDSEVVQLQTQILMRKAFKKSSALAEQILACQISSAGLRAEIAAAEKNL